MEEAARRASRLIVLQEGKAAMDGTPAEIFSRASELRGMGLDAPVPALLAMRLRQLGVCVPDSVYTTEQLRDALLSLRKGGAQC
jgi:ABC-type glutathione transport system ATPase component